MALPYECDTLDAIPEALRGAYAADGDKFRLTVEGLPDAPGLKSALVKERAANHEFKRLNLTPEQITKSLARINQFDAVLAQHVAAHTLEKAALESELSAARTSERYTIANTVLNVALENAGALPEGLDLITERLIDRVAISTVDGKRAATIMQADGTTPMLCKDGTAASFADLVSEARNSFPSLFAGSGAGGGGTPTKGGKSGDKTIARAEFDKLGPLERAATLKTHKLVD